MSNPNPITSIATAFATQLGETVGGPRATIWRTVRTIGPERTHAFVAQAQEVEANGGMLIPDGSRKRTLCGIFFYLVRTQVTDDEAMQINRAWRWQQWKQRQPAKPKATATPAPPTLPPFVWDEADPIIAELTVQPGDASTVKVTVIGRPNQVVERQGVVVVALRSTKTPTLPKGLPPLPSTPTIPGSVHETEHSVRYAWSKVLPRTSPMRCTVSSYMQRVRKTSLPSTGAVN
jgi:hypothetical protein